MGRIKTLVVLTVVWVFLVLVVFYGTQKPFGVENFLAFFDPLTNIALALFILLLATALGERLLPSLPHITPGERLLFSAGTGLGLLSLLTLGLGLLGGLHPWLFYLLSSLLALGLLPQILTLWRRLRGLRLASRPPFFIGLYLSLSLALSLLLALAPPLSFDALLYHLEGPKLYIQAHRIFAFDNLALYFPSLVETLFTWGMLLKGDVVAKLIHYLFGLLTGAAMYILASKRFSPQVGWWSLALIWSMPMVPLIIGWAYADMGLVFYAVLALSALLNWIDSQNRGWLLLSGAASGFAMGVKYTAFWLPLGLATIIACREVKERGKARRVIVSLLSFGLVALLLASPWYLRNLHLVGNPFYPFIFGGRYWDSFLARWYEQAGTGGGLSWRILALPLTVTLGTQDETFYDGRTGPLLLALLPLLILARLSSNREEKESRVVNYLLILALFQFAFWTLGVIRSQSLFQARLLLPGLCFLSVALAWSVRRSEFIWPQFSLPRFVTAVVVLVLALSLVTQTLEFLDHNPLLYLMGLESRDGYLTRNLSDHYRALEYINENLPPSAKLQFLWEPRTYYCQREAQPDTIIGAFKHLVFLEGTAEGIAERWREQGFTHILVHQWGVEFLSQDPRFALNDADWRIWRELESGYLEPVYEDERGNYRLYELR